MTRNAGGVLDTLAYDAFSNRLATVTTGATVRTLTYSASGNTATDGAGGTPLTYTYNSTDRLANVMQGSATIAQYEYNALIQRVSKTVGGTTTHYLYDLLGHLVGEASGATGAISTEYVWLAGRPLAYIVNGVIYYAQTDHLATPQRITDATGAVVWDADYRPFGAATTSGALTFSPRFPGQYYDSETGFHQNYFREYDPVLGRYLQSDPIGLRGGWNTYAYVGGNPVAWVDPLGLEYPGVTPPRGGCTTSGTMSIIDALCHYFHGDGSDMVMSFADADLGYMPKDFPKFRGLLFESYRRIVSVTLDDNSYRIASNLGIYTALGNFTTVLKGEFVSDECCWEFDGYVGALDDPFDFHSLKWGTRSDIAEIVTRYIAGLPDDISGTEFWMTFAQGDNRPVQVKEDW